MSPPPWRVVRVHPLPGHRLLLTFIDGTEGIADLSGVVAGRDPGVFANLVDDAAFRAVRIELGAPSWPGGAELDPCWLYDAIRDSGTWKP